MTINPIYILYGAVFLCAVFLIEGLYYLISDSTSGRHSANRRMRMRTSGADAHKVFTALRRAAPRQWRRMGTFGDLLVKFNLLITQSGLVVSLERMLVIMGALAAVSFVAVLFFAARIPTIPVGISVVAIAAGLGFAIGVLGPVFVLIVLKKRRLKLFEEQLPDALDMMVRSLRSGHPVAIAMGLAAKQMADPIGTEIGIVVDEMTYGLELREALQKMGDRICVQDFQYVVVAISIQHETGGNLADVLNGLATVIRARFRMFRKIKALSAEGRFSAKFLSALPAAFAFVAYSMQPNYYLDVADDPMFLQIAVLAVVLQVVGMLIMRKMINFRV